MGVKDLSKLVKKYAPDAIEKKEYSDFKGQVWAVDASIFFYRFCHDPRSKKKPNSHIDGFYQLILRLLTHGIVPIIIFDGKKPVEKESTLAKRKAVKQKTLDKISQLQQEVIDLFNPSQSTSLKEFDTIDLNESIKGHINEQLIKDKLEEIKKTEGSIIKFQPNVYDDVIYLCKLMGVTAYQANWEADALCTKLYLNGQVQAVMSEDSDILLYRGAHLIRKFNYTNTVELVDLNKILQGIGITHEQFVDLCILSGTDYTEKTISQMGSIRACELIRRGLSIENIISNITNQVKGYAKYGLPNYPKEFDYKAARELLNKAHSLEPSLSSDWSYKFEQFQFEVIQAFMNEKCNYQLKTTEKHYQKLKSFYTNTGKKKLKLKRKPKHP